MFDLGKPQQVRWGTQVIGEIPLGRTRLRSAIGRLLNLFQTTCVYKKTQVLRTTISKKDSLKGRAEEKAVAYSIC